MLFAVTGVDCTYPQFRQVSRLTSEFPVVVPLDGSTVSEEAIPFAGVVAKLFGAPVRFVHAVDGDSEFGESNERFATHVQGLAAQHLPEGVTYTSEIIRGSAAKAILENAKDARLIVISTHGAGGFKAAFIGSVTDKVVRGTSVPVLVVPGTGTETISPTGPVLVAVDGSPESEQSLQIAREYAKASGAEVAIVRAYSIPVPVGTEFAYFPVEQADVLEQAAKDYVAMIAQEGEKSYVVQGSAAESIEATADELAARLVVVASHGKGFAARIALGSTTDRLMHSMKRPLLVVPVRD